MDDYVFLVLAKLKADRSRLEREQREAARLWATDQAPAASKDEHGVNRSSRFTADNFWRMQS
jgi:hypothetical protein